MKKKVFLAVAVTLDTMLMATPVFIDGNGRNCDSRGWWYQSSNGSYACSFWVSISNLWYFMGASGYIQTSRLNDRNGWYYLDTDSGNICMSWTDVNGNWHYINPVSDDRMPAGDCTPNGYYTDGNGAYRPGVGTAQSSGQDDSQGSGQNSMQLSEAQLEDQIIELVNQERAKQGISPIKKDAGLTSTTNVHATEFEVLFSHDRPDGSDCSMTYPRGFGYKSENTAAGQRNPEEIMSSWMHSNGHRANILNPNYDSIGVGYSSLNGRANWIQNFGRKNSGWN